MMGGLAGWRAMMGRRGGGGDPYRQRAGVDLGRRPRPGAEPLVVQLDAAVTPRAVGLGVVLRRADGGLLSIHQRAVGPMTSNEAEYAALLWALELLAPYPPPVAWFVSDSEIVVGQMRGQFDVNSPRLRLLHRQACRLLEEVAEARFIHVPREQNVLADAASREALWQVPPWRRAFLHNAPPWGPTCST